MRIATLFALTILCKTIACAQPYAWTYADAAGSGESTTVYVWSITDGSHGGSDYSHAYAAYLQVQAPSGAVILNAGGWAPVNTMARADGAFEATEMGEYYATSFHEAICTIAGKFLYAPGWFPRIIVGQGWTSWSLNNPYPSIYTKSCLGFEPGTCGPDSIPGSPFLPSPSFWRQFAGVKIGSRPFCITQSQHPGWTGCHLNYAPRAACRRAAEPSHHRGPLGILR
jgi:hypothetical protein